MWTLTKKSFDAIRKQVINEFPKGKLDRINLFLENLTFNPDSNSNGIQRGQQFLFPELASKPVYSSREFEWASEIEKSFPVILSDYNSCLNQGNSGELYLAEDEPDYTAYLENKKLAPPNKRWKAIFICRDGVYNKLNKKICTNTLKLISKAVIGNGDIMFSILKKKTEIVPHYGLNNLHLTCHVGIVVDNLSFLKVHNKKYTWCVGKCLIFDDTFYHSAANNSNNDRIIFLFDFWHPDLHTTEIRILKRILPLIEGLQRRPFVL